MTHLISKNKIIIDEILHGEIEETTERNEKERENVSVSGGVRLNIKSSKLWMSKINNHNCL